MALSTRPLAVNSLSASTSSTPSVNTITGVVGHGVFSGYVATVSQTVTATTITGVVGHGLYTGQTATVTQPHSITAVVGHALLNGKVASVTQNRTITAVVGHELVTGNTATVSQNRSISAVIGHGLFTGYTSVVSRATNITAVIGHGIFNGYVSAITQISSTPTDITAVVGHGLFTGKTSTISQSRTIDTVTGHGVLTGYVTQITQPLTITAVTGHGLYSGKIATINQAGVFTVDDIWNYAIDGTFTVGDIFRLMAASLAGKVSGAETNTIVFRDVNDSTDRISASVDAFGNRTAITHGTGSSTTTGAAVSSPSVVWDYALEGGYTAKELLLLMASATTAKISGAETSTMMFRDLLDSKDRITATVDANGNRTAIILDVT